MTGSEVWNIVMSDVTYSLRHV